MSKGTSGKQAETVKVAGQGSGVAGNKTKHAVSAGSTGAALSAAGSAVTAAGSAVSAAGSKATTAAKSAAQTVQTKVTEHTSNLSQDLKAIQSQARNQLKTAYVKINQELDRLMGPELKKCIDENKDDPIKITHCYDEFQRRVQPVLQKVKAKTLQSNTTLQKCLQSKQTAKDCAKIGVDKTQQFLNQAFNDLKAYLS